MISIQGLIAALFSVITIITSNPSIPQDVKDQVFSEIVQAINKENQVSPAQTATTTAIVPSQTTTAQASSPSQPSVIELGHMTPELIMNGSMVDGNFVINPVVTEGKWTKAYYALTLKEGDEVKAKSSAYFGPNNTADDIRITVEPAQFGTYEYDYRLFIGSGVDSRLDTGTIVFSAQGNVVIGE
jgi:hypothetical protein